MWFIHKLLTTVVCFRFDVDSQFQRQVETKSINTSLLAYGKVVMSLTSSSLMGHIPYRDSKLTKILQGSTLLHGSGSITLTIMYLDSLGGNCKTTMITTISPTAASYTESMNSLKFAQRYMDWTLQININLFVYLSELNMSRTMQLLIKMCHRKHCCQPINKKSSN